MFINVIKTILFKKKLSRLARPLCYLTLCCVVGCAPQLSGTGEAQSPPIDGRYADRVIKFDVPDGPLTPDRIVELWGNGKAPPGRDFGVVRDGSLVVTYKQGKKVNETGLSIQPRIAPRQQYTLQYRIRYPENFQPGLHGKQLGLSGGKGYDGGRGEQARTLGDGWSARLQFDAHENDITNQLYVYHSQMPAKYGDALGTADTRFSLRRGQWHTIKMRVTMQTAVDAADGRIEVWQDGMKRLDVGSIRFVTKEEGRVIDKLRMEMFPGGGGAVPERDFEILVDDFSWEGAKP